MARIEWEDVTYRLKGGKLVLDGVSGSAFAGRLLGVIGPSGAGKVRCSKPYVCIFILWS